MASNGHKDLIAYQKAFSAAMIIFKQTKSFPKEEMYSLTDQIRRSSRSVCANIAEAYRKRTYPKHFVSKLSDADAECAETSVHLDFALECGYLQAVTQKELIEEYKQIGRILGSMMNTPEKFSRFKLPTATAD